MSLPTRTLASHPDLAQLKRQAKELLKDFAVGNPAAVAEIAGHYRGAEATSFALSDAQLVLARAYGFRSWPSLKAFVDGVTVRRLVEAVRAGDAATVRAMVARRPEIVNLDVAEDDEHQALHHAVLTRQPDLVRLLMQLGADPRKGIYPHRQATTALTLAAERGYDEIAAIILEEERRRPRSPMTAVLEQAVPVLGAMQPSKGAVASGDAAWLRARHGEGRLTDATDLVSHAVRSGRDDMVRLLMELGFDPDESGVVDGVDEVVATWGSPLRECAIGGRVAAAEILLAHGANPNTNVYAASSALYESQVRRDAAMASLLETHGARHTATFVGELGLVEQAARLLEEEAAGDIPAGFVAPGSTVGADLLWGAMGNASPDIVRLALDRIPWPREDRRWYRFLENGMYPPPRVDNFRLVLNRSHPDIAGPWNATLLHQITAARGGLSAGERLTLATMVLDAGARLDLRDSVLLSTPLGWACRWGRIELVRLFLDRGADPIEPGAEPWARPRAWAEKMKHREVIDVLAG